MALALALSSMTESVFKVLVIGEPKVGKTAFVSRYCTREWLPNYKATIGGKRKRERKVTHLSIRLSVAINFVQV